MRLAVLALLPGCATAWVTSQVAGEAKLWDEDVREQRVPLAGVEEHLLVTLPLAIEHESIPATTSTAGEPRPAAPSTQGPALPFALHCTVTQTGKEAVYHSAFRYGSSWTKETGVFFLIEALTASAVLVFADHSAGNLATGGYVAADALGTLALFFVPRKEVYRRDDQPTTTPVRSDCPEGLTLDLAGNVLPIDAAGRIGEAGEAALDAWISAPHGQLRVGLPGAAAVLPIELGEQCTWLGAHRVSLPAACQRSLAARPQQTTATIAVPPGTLTQVAQP